jgi:serpin B
MTMKTNIAIMMSAILIASGGMAYEITRPHEQGSPAAQNTPSEDPANIEDLINASNQFAFEMYSNISNGGDNLFFSPYSIFTALGMVYEGARDGTADEIRSVFHFPSDDQTRLELFKALIGLLNGGGTGCNLSTANAMWMQEGFNILREYIDTLQTYYKAGAFNVDFERATETARVKINSWVENQTNGKIKDLFPPGSLTGYTRLVLTNAIYFKGDWLKEFNACLTKKMDFHPDPTTSVDVQMMLCKDDETKFNYTKTDGIQILEMPYSREKLSMLVLLPGAGEMESLESMLTSRKLSEWRGKLSQQSVTIYFPKFTLNTKYFLNGDLSKMGMPSAFLDETADFSGIDGKKDLCISNIIHQAFVSVDEKGTEAAAATGVSFEISAFQPSHPTFCADHPFIFIIQERETGNILFMGKLSDPTK